MNTDPLLKHHHLIRSGLDDAYAVQYESTGDRRGKISQHIQQSRLPLPRRTEDGHERTDLDGKGNVFEGISRTTIFPCLSR